MTPDLHPTVTTDKTVEVLHDEKAEAALPGPLETRYANLTRKQAIRTFWKAIIFCGIACWAGLNDGFQGQLPGNIIPLPAFVATMANIQLNGAPAVSSQVISFWGGFSSMSQIFGQFFGGMIADRIGRKPTMYVFVTLFLLGSALAVSAQNWQWWLGAGVVTKLGLGIAQTTLIVYLSEISPFQLRGTMMAAYQLFLAAGQLIGASGTQISISVSPNTWRPLIASEFVITGLFCLMLPFVPESHAYLIRKGDEAAAKKVMLRIYGTAPNYDVDHEYLVVKEQIDAEIAFTKATAGGSYAEIFKGPNLRRTIAAVVGISLQPLAGAPLLFSYSTYYFSVAGIEDPFLTTVIIFAVLLVVIAITMALCETIGRRPLLLTGCVAMFLFSTGLAITGHFSSSPAVNKASLALLIMWVIAYSWSAAPIGFISAGETSTPHLRAKTSSLAFASYSSLFFIYYWTVPYMIAPDAANWGIKAAYLFAGQLIPMTVLVYFFYPETTGRTYVELDELYNRGIPARKFAQTITSTDSRGLKQAQ